MRPRSRSPLVLAVMVSSGSNSREDHSSRKGGARDRFKTPVSHGGARGEKSKERGGDEPQRGLSTTRDAGIRRLSPRPEGVAAARGRLRRQTSSTTPLRSSASVFLASDPSAPQPWPRGF